MKLNEMKQAFVQAYQKEAKNVYFAPGRVNLIGEHTDYNGGHVFPCALSFGTYLLIAPNTDNVLRFRSLNIEGEVVVPVSPSLPVLPNNSWVNYPLGVIAQFLSTVTHYLLGKTKSVEPMMPLSGFDMLFWGNVPVGSGLSSSAAIEVVTAYAFNDMLHKGFDLTELALVGQTAEHLYADVNCGIMDQFASAHGQKDHAIDLDCSTYSYELVPVKLNGIQVVITNTHSPHKLESGAYNARVSQCQTALKEIKALGYPDIRNLADLSQEDFDKVADKMVDPIAKRRARHVVGEVKRTNDAIAALKKGDIDAFGQLMNQSHISLRDDYEVTGPELDALAEAAWKIDGVIGSRMTGGGFGGCTVSLVKEEAIPTFIDQVGKEYTQKTGLVADFYVAQIGDGVHKIQ